MFDEGEHEAQEVPTDVCSEGRRGPQRSGDHFDEALAALRVRIREADDNLRLIESQAPDALGVLTGHLDGMRGALDSLDPADLADESLMGTVLAVEEARRKLDALNAIALGRLAASGLTEATLGVGVRTWKSNRTHAAGSTVGRELKVARTLARFPAFATALANGDISTDHVLALANANKGERIAEELLALQDDLVAFARRHRYPIFVRHLRALGGLLDQDGPEPDCGDRDTASMSSDLEGHLHLRLELSGHNAVTAERIINDETDRQYRAAVRSHEATGLPIPTRGILRARAVVELLRRGASANPSSAKPATEAVLPVMTDGMGRPTGVRSIDGGDVDAVTAAMLFCDANLQPVVLDPSGDPLHLGRSTRFFTPVQRQALLLRDGGCIFPGCEAPAQWCDAHHELPWEERGCTDIDNGALLCRRHHGLVHGHDPWRIEHLDIGDLPPDLLEAHRVRAATAGLEPACDVRVWRTPTGALLLAQNATDHNGPAPPRGP